jgi:hypothetical protein
MIRAIDPREAGSQNVAAKAASRRAFQQGRGFTEAGDPAFAQRAILRDSERRRRLQEDER